ncbi:BMP family ABC transporter substrate-binding protein [Oceanibacterium hippocampi]|uniref:Purine-binding protein n=1 Tax=Oceanibacterium hippocampi TaxID=745714 RepID=A0A1Y5TXT3_9PROT|nr:BMP family ABC transporter substrate-binding protein [Oceanibacterium hippocampi]SLN76010.1 Purine-binding protein precursor [Oceanibacterium hippocampi]
MRRLSNALVAMVAAVGLLAAAGTAGAADKVKVGFIFVGPIGDHGWSYEHNQGRLAIEKEFGDKVETTYVENVSEGPDAERVIQRLAQGGSDIIFTTSFGFMNPTIKVAKRFPKVKFEHATGFKRDANVSTYSSRFYEGRHVIGLIAGKMTKTNTIGYIASFPIPEVVRGINAAYLAAKSVNPDIKFKVVWVSTWFDPGKEADAAKALIDQGADILMQHTDSPAAMKIAEEAGIFAFGQASDMHRFGPNAQLTSIVDAWSPYYISRVKAVMDGTWESTDTWGGFDSGMVLLSDYSDKIPADVREMAEKAHDAIKAGTLHPFTGPINKQDGSVWLKAGETAPDGDLLGMNFYVEGVEGSLPK